ncbi:hypothetical protein GMDG_05648 [Pseudogymnoascus destructans 20631-21]|uniref:NAD-dependent protein deacetylase n=1 Tax=Pseudogymnoascus destructans (strain ATCC MYA-4855 / 20631-21) TaxID=658429 RepID=L8FQ89_PSED2|nr:hypothetical protein GMDG_05648 [Pseudogymnoascus destructans 20631-21]
MGQDSSHELVDEALPSQTLQDRTISSVASYLKSGKAKRVVVLTGAGISTSAGIPDFRSPDTGLYSNLARLNLPYPEAVFDISFFRQNPAPFYMLAQELYPGKYKPTVAHAFIALLAKKGLLHMLLTQNIDCLERAAGVPPEKVVEAHGSFASQGCIDCKTEYPGEFMREFVKSGDIPYCEDEACGGLVKPDITFFGESLPQRFHMNTHVPAQADLMIIIGTSLSVHPFASLPDMALEGTPRVLLNMERVGTLGSRPDDVLLLGDCDGQVRRLADELGWRDELEAVYKGVGGPEAEREPATPSAKQEALEDEIEKLTAEVEQALKLSNGHKSVDHKSVDHALKISDGHKNWLEKHLATKLATGAPTEAVSPANDVKTQRQDTQKPDVEERAQNRVVTTSRKLVKLATQP